ncbi:hypothetical protein [Desulfoscipio gibsoniae]|uniref:Uncharacterized protein n=1 Tax=Desulfoscipio gibsoniae DSM 7213 TaxID=767817 RepID=R4KH10_9FIRM|nr:hypothetical protein [Desulfoscipio gibsoniae]AGL02478.1 hypothetical protein Desgi_3118 [Desulfoscipio gibsoniae DSM 7213]
MDKEQLQILRLPLIGVKMNTFTKDRNFKAIIMIGSYFIPKSLYLIVNQAISPTSML